MKLADLYVEFREKGLRRVMGRMKALRGRLEGVNSALTTMDRYAKRTLLGVAGVIGGATAAAARFENQMAMVSTMLDETSMKMMGPFSEGIRGLSRKFGESTATLSQGLYNVLSASVAPEKAMEVLRVATESAIGGFTQTETAASAVVNILNSYGMSADRAGEVSDKLFATVKRGQLTFEQLASGIGKASATAAIAGMSLDELLATIATTTRAGISADEAMTAVVGAIQSFIKPAKDSQELAKKLGFELSSATLRAEGLAGVMEKINGLSAEQVAVLFPNIRGLKAIAAAMQDMTGFGIDLDMMLNSTGRRQEAFSKASETLTFKLGQLKSQVLDIATSLGQKLSPFIVDVTKAIGLLVMKLRKGEDTFLDQIVAVMKFVAALSAAVIGVKALMAAITALVAHPLVALGTVIAGAVLHLTNFFGLFDYGRGKIKNMADEYEKAMERIKQEGEPQTWAGRTEQWQKKWQERRDAAAKMAPEFVEAAQRDPKEMTEKQLEQFRKMGKEMSFWEKALDIPGLVEQLKAGGEQARKAVEDLRIALAEEATAQTEAVIDSIKETRENFSKEVTKAEKAYEEARQDAKEAKEKYLELKEAGAPEAIIAITKTGYEWDVAKRAKVKAFDELRRKQKVYNEEFKELNRLEKKATEQLELLRGRGEDVGNAFEEITGAAKDTIGEISGDFGKAIEQQIEHASKVAEANKNILGEIARAEIRLAEEGPVERLKLLMREKKERLAAADESLEKEKNINELYKLRRKENIEAYKEQRKAGLERLEERIEGLRERAEPRAGRSVNMRSLWSQIQRSMLERRTEKEMLKVQQKIEKHTAETAKTVKDLGNVTGP